MLGRYGTGRHLFALQAQAEDTCRNGTPKGIGTFGSVALDAARESLGSEGARVCERGREGRGRCLAGRARHHSRAGERGRADAQRGAYPVRPPSGHHLEGGERERVGRGGFEVPRLFRFLRTPEALHFPPPVSFAPGRVGRCLEGEHCPSRRRCVRRAFRASVCAGRGGLFRSGGRGGRRCLQAFAQARYRDRVCGIQQGACRRGSHPCVCRKSPPAVVGSAFGAEAGDGHRPRIPDGMQGGVSRCARRVAA